MKAVTVYFGEDYKRLLDAFVNSWKKNCSIPLQVIEMDPPETGTRNKDFYANHEKLKVWYKYIEGDTILVDCDMLCRGDISDGFESVDHIGITERPGAFPVNGGVVFVRDNGKSIEFLQKWIEIDRQMLTNASFHTPYYDRYGGLNQSSMGWMIDNYSEYITKMPCTTYNLCDGQWAQWKSAKMIHLKGFLRDKILGKSIPPEWSIPQMKEIKEEWEAYTEIG